MCGSTIYKPSQISINSLPHGVFAYIQPGRRGGEESRS